MHIAWLVGLVAGCGSGGTLVEPGGDAVPPPASDLQAVFQTAMSDVLAVSGEGLRVAYDDVMTHGSPSCPSYYDTQGLWYDDCSTDGGAEFHGYVYEVEQYVPGDEYWTIYGEAMGRAPDSRDFDFSGYAYYGDVSDDFGNRSLYTGVAGTFRWEGAEDGSWLKEGGSPAVYLLATTDSRGKRWMYLEGALGDVGGDPAQAVDFGGLSLGDRTFGLPCDNEPTGTAWIRDREGAWYELVFDTACDGCGRVSRDGDDHGEVCADFSQWLEWEGKPW